jgi:hypothetical protein
MARNLHFTFERSHFVPTQLQHNFNMMDHDYDYLVLVSCLLFPFGDGRVVSDVTATIAILSSVLTLYRYSSLALRQGQVVAGAPSRQQSQNHPTSTNFVIIKDRAWQPLQ